MDASEKTTLEADKVAFVKLPVTVKVPPTLLFPVLVTLAKVLAPANVCAPEVTIPGLVASAGLRLRTLLLIVIPLLVLVPTVPTDIADGTVAVQAVPFQVNTCPLVLGTMVEIELVPFPMTTPFAGMLARPVPP